VALGRRKDIVPVEPIEARIVNNPRSLVASAIQYRLDDISYNTYRFRDETWQRELWRLYDIVPEFGYAARWVGNCCSQVRVYVAKVDKLGRVQGEATKPKVAALSDTVLGGPAARREHLRACGINLTVAGEFYFMGRTESGKDKWYVLSSSELRRIKGDLYWGSGDFRRPVDLDNSLVTRVWTPHPQRVWCADSPARSCQPILRELEQLTKYVFSQIDSRLVGAGLLIIPNNLDLPQDPNNPDASASDTLMMRLATAGAASLRGEGTALAVLPHIIEASPEDVERGFKLLGFDSELSKQALELRAEAIRRLGLGMDMPPEALSGMGEANHWNGWFIDGYGIKVHIEPVMNRICDALTTAYLVPHLKKMGENPDEYVYSYDTSPLSVRPQRLQDALNLYEKDLLSAEAVRNAGYFKEDDKPTDEESAMRFTREVVLRDPNLFAKQGVRELTGISEEMLGQEEFLLATGSTGEGAGPPPPPAPFTGIQSELPGPMPDTMGEIQAPPGQAPGAVTASVATREDLALVVLAEAVVRRAMEVAGKRLLDRHNRDRWPDVPHFDLHTRIQVQDTAHANRLLANAWTQLPGLTEVLDATVDIESLQASLTRYCVTLLVNSMPHEPRNLYAVLQREGLIGAP
jgi:hypothetical protein